MCNPQLNNQLINSTNISGANHFGSLEIWQRLDPKVEKEMATHSSILAWKIP